MIRVSLFILKFKWFLVHFLRIFTSCTSSNFTVYTVIDLSKHCLCCTWPALLQHVVLLCIVTAGPVYIAAGVIQNACRIRIVIAPRSNVLMWTNHNISHNNSIFKKRLIACVLWKLLHLCKLKKNLTWFVYAPIYPPPPGLHLSNWRPNHHQRIQTGI